MSSLRPNDVVVECHGGNESNLHFHNFADADWQIVDDHLQVFASESNSLFRPGAVLGVFALGAWHLVRRRGVGLDFVGKEE